MGEDAQQVGDELLVADEAVPLVVDEQPVAVGRRDEVERLGVDGGVPQVEDESRGAVLAELPVVDEQPAVVWVEPQGEDEQPAVVLAELPVVDEVAQQDAAEQRAWVGAGRQVSAGRRGDRFQYRDRSVWGGDGLPGHCCGPDGDDRGRELSASPGDRGPSPVSCSSAISEQTAIGYSAFWPLRQSLQWSYWPQQGPAQLS